jgi:hypothetical protein
MSSYLFAPLHACYGTEPFLNTGGCVHACETRLLLEQLVNHEKVAGQIDDGVIYSIVENYSQRPTKLI